MDNGPLRSGRKVGRPSTGDADFRTARRAHLPKSRPRRLAPGGFAAPSRRRFPLWMGPNICSRERKAPALGPGAAPDELPLAPDSSRKYLKVKGIIRILHGRLPERGCPAVKAPKTREKNNARNAFRALFLAMSVFQRRSSDIARRSARSRLVITTRSERSKRISASSIQTCLPPSRVTNSASMRPDGARATESTVPT